MVGFSVLICYESMTNNTLPYQKQSSAFFFLLVKVWSGWLIMSLESQVFIYFTSSQKRSGRISCGILLGILKGIPKY